MRISDCSSDVCSSDLIAAGGEGAPLAAYGDYLLFGDDLADRILLNIGGIANLTFVSSTRNGRWSSCTDIGPGNTVMDQLVQRNFPSLRFAPDGRSEEHTSELQSLMRHSYADFCL